MPARLVGRRRREVWIAGALAVAFAALVLWRPLVHFGTHTFGAFDISAQATSLTQVEPQWRPANPQLSDPPLQMHPWLLFNRSELAAGRWPLWNPFNGTGTPHLANFQSAALSPFSFPAYVLPIKAARVVAAVAKIALLAFFAYLFLRELELGRAAAATGAIVYATAGFHLVCLQYPHTSIKVAYIAAFYFAERALRAVERGEPLPLGAVAGLALAAAAAVVGGHPETLLWCGVVGFGYGAWRAWTFLARTGERAPRVRATLALTLALVAGTLLGAPQLLPFLEYLPLSDAIGRERHALEALHGENLPLLFFPDLAGSPVGDGLIRRSWPAPTYEAVTSFYCGGLSIWLAAFGLLGARRSRAARFFALCLVAWLCYGWNLFGLATWLGRTTILGLVPIHRCHALWVLPCSVLAAFGAERLTTGSARATARQIAWTIGSGGVLLLAFQLGALAFARTTAQRLGLGLPAIAEVALPHVTALSAIFAAGVLGVAAWRGAQRIWARRAGAGLLFAALFAQSGAWLAAYTPIVEDRFVYPRTEAIEALREAVGSERVLFTGRDCVRADSNLAYGLRMVTSYDAMEIGDVAVLLERLFAATPNDMTTTVSSRKALELFGVRFVARRRLLPLGESDVGGEPMASFDALAWARGERDTQLGFEPVAELAEGRTIRRRFEATHDDLDQVVLDFLDDQAAHGAEVVVAVEDVERSEVIGTIRARLGDLPVSLPGRRRVALDLDPQPESRGRVFEVSASSPDAAAGRAPRVLAPHALGERARARPRLAFDAQYGTREFAEVARAGNHRVSRYDGGGGTAWLVGRTVLAETHELALALTLAPEIDALAVAVLEGEGAPALDHPLTLARLEPVSSNPTRLAWRSACAEPAVLVVSQPYYPGWRARVDGADVPLWRANYAFSAVALPAGEHEVELAYEPRSFHLGLTLALATLVLGTAALGLAALRRARGRAAILPR